jgi:hypothetical protein
MNIAIVLYGQPRDYMSGYNNIMKYINKQQACKFDFFYHCWTLNEHEEYKHSPWRNIDKNTIVYNNTLNAELQKLYDPISCEYENQNNVLFEESLYKNTIAFNNTTGLKINNINNTIYQMYSRNKARNILHNYINIHNIKYDFVMMVRFDIRVMPEINFNELTKNKTYISNINCPRKVISDNCIITSINVFLEWFDIYDKLNEILDNKKISENISNINEELEINPEQLLLAKYIYHYINLDNLLYFQGGLI